MVLPPPERPALSKGLVTTRTATLLAVGMAGLHLLRFRSPFYTLDDAWISFRVARNWLEHGALTFNADLAPVEGMTNLLWTLLSTTWIAALPSYDPIFPARVVGAALYLATIGLLCLAAAELARSLGGKEGLAALLAGTLAASSGTMAYYATSGLETPLWTFLLAASLLAFQRASCGRSPTPALALGTLLGLLAATRPEGVLTGLLLIAALGLWGWKRALTALLPFALLVMGMEVFRLATYGELVPNTFHAKPPSLELGIPYVARWALGATGALGLLAILPLAREKMGAALATLVLVMMAAAAWSGGDWMPGYRRLLLPTMALYLLAALGVAATSGRRRVVGATALVALLSGSAFMALGGHDSQVYAHTKFAWLGQLVEETQGIETVALVDIGRFGWGFHGSVYDLAGLTDAHIARLPREGARAGWDQAYFETRSPELALAITENAIAFPMQEPLRPRDMDESLFQSILEHGGYRLHTQVQMSPGFWCMVFAREDILLPEDLWGPPSPIDFRQAVMDYYERAGTFSDG